ncbi:right-handed parallel beta-helix repeat-containing protein [Patescibacteria group bacterium]|nr:right-handed parallel beta-helix repeat-containing protein [Patescibacteria group bacterium]MBU4580561.1 right-handed parallel beta-helix repeat-containing protein [Patescibacteria group bacterium]
MDFLKTKNKEFFARYLALVAVFAVIFFGLTTTPANAATDGWHIRDDATGGECSVIGNWNAGSKTCTLSQNLSQGIIIDSNNITLDGNGRTIIGSNTGYGVYLFGRNGVTIKNLNVKQFSYGIYLYSSSGNTLTDNTASNNVIGIFLYDSNNNILTGNTANSNSYGGIVFNSSSNNILTDNTASNNNSFYYSSGIYLFYSSNNILTGNTASNNTIEGICLEGSSNNTLTGNTASNNVSGISLYYSNNNQIYKNNFISNSRQVFVSTDGSGNIFNLATPTGGNYWSNFDEPIEGCIDANNDGFCDAPYIFTGGQDNLPWTKKDWWLVPQNHPPTLSYSQDFGYIDDGINPDSGSADTNFDFKAVYTDKDNDSPTDIRTIIFDGSSSGIPAIEISSDAMILDLSAATELRDGDYANGEQYMLAKSFLVGTYRYRFQASDGKGLSSIFDGIAGGKEQKFKVTENLNQPPIISEIKQYQIDSPDSLVEIPEGNKIDSGNNKTPKVSIEFRAKVSDPDNDKVNLIVSLNKFIEGSTDVLLYSMSPSGFVNSGEIASVKFENLEEGDYYWEIQAIDDKGNESGKILFGEQSRIKPDFKFSNDFSFVHMTDVHLGSNFATLAWLGNEDWYEELSYPRFTDALYEIGYEYNTKLGLSERPDFILISGDNVEYNNPIWLADFKSITADFTSKTGIEFYIVPGNHDRFDSASSAFECKKDSHYPCDWSGGNDWLKNYITAIGEQQNVNIFFPWTENLRQSAPQGVNQYNYSFYHKGIQFIGLDSGEDTADLPDLIDTKPESTGISDAAMIMLNSLDSNIPKIIFMHSPVFTTGQYPEAGNEYENESIAKNRFRFVKYAEKNSVKSILAGHTHKDIIHNSDGSLFTGSQIINSPLYIQTQSATKDNFIDENTEYKHGYRIIDVKKGVVTPHVVVEETKFYNKIIADLDQASAEKPIKLNIYTDSENPDLFQSNRMYQNTDDSYFTAPFSDRSIVYNYNKPISKVSIFNTKAENNNYDLFISNNKEDFTKFSLDYFHNQGIFGFKIRNKEYCENILLTTKCEGGFLAVFNNANKMIDLLKFRDMNIKGNVEDNISINWPLIPKWPLSPILNNILSGVNLTVNGDSDTIFEEYKEKITIQLHSPGQLQVVDSNGRVSGLVNGKVKEEIPYSFYDEMNEAVILFVDQGVDENQYKYKVVGTADADYGLTITKKDDTGAAEKIIEFDGSKIPTTPGQIHEYFIDWNALENNEKGVTLKIDKEGDGAFEQTVNVGANFSDNTPPASAISISGTKGNNGWHISDVQLSLSAQDNDGGVGVEKTEYSWDNGQTWNKYTDPLAITEEGVRNILYRSQDFFGNIETAKTEEIKIDKTFPEVKIYFNALDRVLKVEGFDNLTQTALTINGGKNYLLADEAGNGLKIIFGKIKTEGHEIKADIYGLQYGGNQAIMLPKTELKYEWSLDKNNLIKELEQKIEVKNLFEIQAKYSGKKNITSIDIEEKNKKEKDLEKKQKFEGIKIIKIITEKGGINYNF